jgi:glycosyltransferase involved in cell wall biosynthesis
MSKKRTLLCVANYPANTGYAWDFIERLYADLANDLAPSGVNTYVAYPEIEAPPRSLTNSAAKAICLPMGLKRPREAFSIARKIRALGVRAVYFTDRRFATWAYGLLRMNGVHFIVVHDHSSGERAPGSVGRQLVKAAVVKLPLISADKLVAVSDFVARRDAEVGLVPIRKICRIWNGLPTSYFDRLLDSGLTKASLGLPSDRPTVVAAGRAVQEKGMLDLVDAFAMLVGNWPRSEPKPFLVYLGDGPQLPDIRARAASLGLGGDTHFPGFEPSPHKYMAVADACAVPSIWQDALPLAVLEPMMLGRPVVATRVGGIPEMVRDGEEGLLVDGHAPDQLAGALSQVLQNAELSSRLGRNAHLRARQHFTQERQREQLAALFRAGLGA